MIDGPQQKLRELISYAKGDAALAAIVPQLEELLGTLGDRTTALVDMHGHQKSLVRQLREVLQCLLVDKEVPKEVVRRVLRVCNAYDVVSRITEEQEEQA